VAKLKCHCKAEYARRVARCAPAGIARSPASGHPKPREASLSAKRRDRSLRVAAEVARG
jgi:hypothetical protein